MTSAEMRAKALELALDIAKTKVVRGFQPVKASEVVADAETFADFLDRSPGPPRERLR